MLLRGNDHKLNYIPRKSTSKSHEMNYLSKLGVLRSLLFISALLCCPLVWLADTEPAGMGVITAYVVPSLVIMLLFVLLLDIMMNGIFMFEQQAEVKAERRIRLWTGVVTVGLLLIFWVPYFRTIGEL